MKRKILSLILVFAMTVSLLTVGTGAVEPTYGDTAGHWAEDSIDRWSGHGIIQGSNGEFDPNGQLTCAQLATILARLLKLPAGPDAGFSDVAADAWYADAVNRCAAAGILNGNGDGTVDPNGAISRERAMVMLGRALGIQPIENPNLTKYGDAAKISAYAQGYVAAMIEAGIVTGVGGDQIAPKDDINRASTVTILDRAIAVYADEDGQTIDASKVNGLILIAAKDVTVKNAPKGTSILVCKDASGATVNGKTVDAGTSAAAEEAQPAKPATGGGSSGGNSGGSTPSISNLTVAEAKTVSGGTYQNVTITDAVGNGEVTLTGLTIRGDLAIKGGGSNSIKLEDCTVGGKVIMDKAGGQPPRLHLTNTPVKAVEVKQPAILESADAASAITAVTAQADTTVQGANTKIDKMNVPASAEQPVYLIVNDAEVTQINTNKAASIGGNGKVETVVAEAPVNVDSATVDKVEVPATAEDIVVNVSGDSAIEIKADSDSTKIAADNADNITVSGEAKDSVSTHTHVWNQGEVTKQPTCSEEGVKTYTCTAENCPANTKTESIAKIAHTEVIDAAIAADCLGSGKTEGKHCSVCGAVIAAQEEIKPLGHDFTGNYSNDANGHWHKCSRCDVTEEKMAHVYPENADCTKAVNCTACGYTKPAGQHMWNEGEVTTAATCTVNGVKTYTCAACKQTKTEEIIAAGHTSGEPIHENEKTATCVEAGSYDLVVYCAICKAEISRTSQIVTATGHTEAVLPAKAATCTETGLTAGKKCSVCDAVIEAQTEIPALGHKWDNGVITVEPTETTEGVKTYTCSVCKAIKTEKVPTVSASKLRWDSAGVLSWDSEEGVTNYRIKIKNSTGEVVGISSVNTSKCDLWLDICKDNKWMASSGVYSIEVFAMDSDWKEKGTVGTIENAVELTVDGSVDYTYEVTGETTYTLTLEQGAPTGICCVRWTTDGFSQHASFEVDGSTMTYEKTRVKAFCDGDEIGLRIVTSNKLNGNIWSLTATPIVTKTYRAVQDTKNGYDIAWTVEGGALKACLTAPGVSDPSVKFTIYLYNTATGKHSFYSNCRGDGEVAHPLSVATGEYDRVRVYSSISGNDYSEETPLADWALEKKVITSANKIEFPHDVSKINVTVQKNENSGTQYKYTFEGLDFTKYSYILTNPSVKSSLTLTTASANGAGTWIGAGMTLVARTVEVTEASYTILTSESCSIDIVQPE